MKDVKEILIEAYGKSFHEELTEKQVSDMIRFDIDWGLAIPDSSSRKMSFVEDKIKKYSELQIEEQYNFWLKEEKRLKERYPAIHDKENK